jgi:predicted RND superfamily exporter protein
MIMGMMPIALSKAAGAEAKAGLAIVLIGGLTSSMFLTLLVVPVVYQRFDKWKRLCDAVLSRKGQLGLHHLVSVPTYIAMEVPQSRCHTDCCDKPGRNV